MRKKQEKKTIETKKPEKKTRKNTMRKRQEKRL